MLADTVVDMIFPCSTKPSFDIFFFFFNASPAVFAWKTYVFPIHPEIDPALPRMKEPAADTAGLVQQASTMH